MDEEILVGVFGAPHGVRGELRVKSYTQDPLALAGYDGLHDARGRAFVFVSCRLLKDDLLVVRVKGVADRDAARSLTNEKLYIARASLPPPDEDEFYCRDLIGLRAETREGVFLGTIVAVPNYGAGDILEVAPPRGDTLLFPFTRLVVPEVDMASGRVIVDPPLETDGDRPEA